MTYLFLMYTTFLPVPCFISNPFSTNKFRSVTVCFTLLPVRRAHYCKYSSNKRNAVSQKEAVWKIRIWTLIADSALTVSSNPVLYKTTYSHGNSSLEVSLKRHEVLESGHSILQQTATNTGKEVAMVQKFFLLNSPFRNEKAVKGLLITYLTNISFFSKKVVIRTHLYVFLRGIPLKKT